MSTFAVILDANVLIPAAPRDTLLRAAERGLYRLHWSAEILSEVERNLVKHGLTDAENARRLIGVLWDVFPEAAVTRYENLMTGLSNDPKDRHVLAAAIRASAQVIITENLTDFPEAVLSPYDIEAQSVDEFLTYLFSLAPSVMTQIIHEQAADLNHPPMTARGVLTELELIAPTFVQLVTKRL